MLKNLKTETTDIHRILKKVRCLIATANILYIKFFTLQIHSTTNTTKTQIMMTEQCLREHNKIQHTERIFFLNEIVALQYQP